MKSIRWIYRYCFPAGWILVAFLALAFGIYNYYREVDLRVDVLHARLQLNNYQYLEGKADSLIRVTVMDLEGTVIYDSRQDVSSMENHIDRQEVVNAVNDGQGYDIVRESNTDGKYYFYSATLFPNFIVRSAVPYDTKMIDELIPNYSNVFFVIATFLLIIFIMHLINRNKMREEDRNRYKHQITENAAHELKTPTSIIGGCLETLIQNPDLDDGQRHDFLIRAFRQTQMMAKVLDDMGTLSRLKHGNIGDGIKDSVLDVMEILDSVLAESGPELKSLDIEVEKDCPEHMVMKASSVLLISLFRNIVDNTIIYASGTDSLRIHGEYIDGKMIRLVFSDNGPGVPEEDLGRIFERFYRLDKGRSRKLGGTGLGLSIVRNIARRYGGDARAFRGKDGGLDIQVTLNTGI